MKRFRDSEKQKKYDDLVKNGSTQLDALYKIRDSKFNDGEIDKTVQRIQELKKSLETATIEEKQEIEVQIGECEGYLRELEEIDGEEPGTYQNGNPYKEESKEDFDFYTVCVEELDFVEDENGEYFDTYMVVEETILEDYDEALKKYEEYCEKYTDNIVALYHDTTQGRDCLKIKE